MKIDELKAEILALRIEDRLQLVEDIWNSIIASEDELPVPPEEIALMEQRLAAHKKAPHEGVKWEDLKERLLKHG